MDKNTNLQLRAKGLEVSKTKQDYDNLNVKFNNLKNVLNDKDETNNRLQEKIKNLRNILKEKEESMLRLKSNVSEVTSDSEDASILWGSLRVERNVQGYEEWYKKEIILPAIRKYFDELENRGNPTQRVFRIIKRKLSHLPYKVVNCDKSEINKEKDRLIEVNTKILMGTLNEFVSGNCEEEKIR